MEAKGPPEQCYEAFPNLPPNAALGAAGGESGQNGNAERQLRLEFILRSEILPRLGDLHPSWPTRTGSPASSPPTSADIETFAALVMSPDESGAAAFLRRMVARGYDFETVVERLAAPTARRLGELWEDDRCDFLDVTFGVARLQECLAMMSGAPAALVRERPRRALLISTPGDTHCFGLEVVGALLSAAGWTVTYHRGLDIEENQQEAADEWTHVVGVTMGALVRPETVARTVQAVRQASRNPGVAVMVGGARFNTQPELVARVGADGAAPDGPTAVVLAKRLLLRQIADAPWAPG